MKVLKKGFYVVSLLLLIIGAYIIYDRSFSPTAKIGKENKANVAHLKIGMNKDDVIEIMGKPEIVGVDKETIFYGYPSDNVDYLDIKIYFDEKGNICKIFLPEN